MPLKAGRRRAARARCRATKKLAPSAAEDPTLAAAGDLAKAAPALTLRCCPSPRLFAARERQACPRPFSLGTPCRCCCLSPVTVPVREVLRHGHVKAVRVDDRPAVGASCRCPRTIKGQRAQVVAGSWRCFDSPATCRRRSGRRPLPTWSVHAPTSVAVKVPRVQVVRCRVPPLPYVPSVTSAGGQRATCLRKRARGGSTRCRRRPGT